MFGERRTMMKPRRNALNVAISTLMMLLLISGCGKPSEEREVKGILAGEDADSLGKVSTSEESAASSEDADSPDEPARPPTVPMRFRPRKKVPLPARMPTVPMRLRLREKPPLPAKKTSSPRRLRP